MEAIIEELGQTLLALLGGGMVIAMFLFVLNAVASF